MYITNWGAAPAVVVLTAQTWLGVLALAVAGIVSLHLLFLFVANVVIWV
jgi:hypothetical protein